MLVVFSAFFAAFAPFTMLVLPLATLTVARVVGMPLAVITFTTAY